MTRSRIAAPILVLAGLAAGLWLAPSRQADAQAPGSPVAINAADHPSLQAAFDALPAEGGVVRIPPGDYDITEPLVISKPETRVEGSGAATHIRNHNEQGKPALILQHPKREAAQSSSERGQTYLWRVQLADFRVSGNPKSGDGIYAHGINEIYIHGMSIDRNGGHGLNCQDCLEDPRINDSIFTYNAKAGVNIQGGHDIVVNGNQFEENQDGLRCIDSFNLCMNANNIDDHLRHGVVIENTYGSVLSGNMIEECAGTAIVLDRDVYGVTIGSNVIAHNQGGGVDVRDAWGSSISANTFTIMPNPAVRIGPNSGRIAITGNAFSNSYIGPDTRRPEDYEAKWPQKVYAAGIELDGTSDIAISGNLFTGLIEEAVRTKGRCIRIALSGNVASDLGRKRGEKLAAFNMSGAEQVTAGLNAIEKGFEGSSR
ncbi:MAG: right-handed parallel beta-helix repeat-containing protein [Acidobacteria bacterium]|nr:right-handed parallel beta-helix repeat-containing protein [Acidobacteriota bacterium]